jgi:uncharacterized protein (DUF2461 family)
MAEDIDQARERDAFEAELQQEVGRRLNATIAAAIKMRTGAYSESLHEAILRNLLERFSRDKNPLMTHFAGLRELPLDDESRAQRAAAFEQILHHYLPGVLREEFHRAGLPEIPPAVQGEIPDAS